VQGTGPDGQIRAEDVMNFSPTAAVQAPAVGAPTAPGAFVDIPVSGMRKVRFMV
jgi:pyruvate/2-oxoglutarate dehydrogenase complex dihydrolipoamide acyltransferase (E2) component